MGNLYIIFMIAFLVMIMPGIFKILMVVWLISMVLRLFRPRKNPTQSNPFEEETTQSNQYQRKSNSDIIDVEFTQRDSKPDTE